MSFASRHHSSLPPITSLPSDKDGDHEHSITNSSPGPDTENDSEAEHPTNRESTAPVSGDDTSWATSPGAGLILNLEFSRIHSWLHVLVPARRVAKLDAVKVSFIGEGRILPHLHKRSRSSRIMSTKP